jgi:pyridoxal phosphate enzyme (YggS family)
MLIDRFKAISASVRLLGNSKTKLIVVCKNQSFDRIKTLIDLGHQDFGENKVQEAKIKWTSFMEKNKNINLHFIGKLQSNKAKEAVNLFSHIHSLDSQKLAEILDKEELEQKKKLKYFIQINTGNEKQKAGINLESSGEFIKFCKSKTKLNIIGLMCIPPLGQNPSSHFSKLSNLARMINLKELSIGMSNDFKIAIEHHATYVRIGSSIFSKN